MSQDERFVEAEEKVNELSDDLHGKLNGKDKKQIEEVRNTMYESQSYAEEEHFRYGLTLGALLIQEIYEVHGARYFKPDM